MENTESKSKWAPIVVVVLVILAVGGYFMFGRGAVKPLAKVESVATVNGVAIPKATFDTQLASAIASYTAQGVDATSTDKLAQIKTQVLDNLVNNELLNQGVVSAGIKAADADVETQYQALVTQAGGLDKLQAEMVKSNLTEAQLRENISKQLVVQAYLLKNIDISKITVTDAEIAQFYTEYSKAQKDAGQKTVPALKDLSEQIKQQLISNKQQVMVNDFLATLRAKAKIETSATL